MLDSFETQQVRPGGPQATRWPVLHLAEGPAMCPVPAPACSSGDSVRGLQAGALAGRLYSGLLSGGASGPVRLACPAVSWQASPRAVLSTPACTGPASMGDEVVQCSNYGQKACHKAYVATGS